MQHHRHPGLAGRLATDRDGLEPHPDATRDDAHLVWVPLPDPGSREVGSLEGLLCVPTRPGAVRLVAVPHLAANLALGDELAVGEWEGEPVARGELASAVTGTVRVVLAAGRSWNEAARTIDAAAAETCGPRMCWFDVIGAGAVAASVPRPALAGVFARLDALAADDVLRWEYATAERHVVRELGH